jgi:hypothetical protein
MEDSMDIDGGAGGVMEVDMATDEGEQQHDYSRLLGRTTEQQAQQQAQAQYQYQQPQQHQPLSRRSSMSHEEECERRASIKAILADHSVTPIERRKSIQHLMDGRRSSIGTNSVASSCSGNGDNNNNNNSPGGHGPFEDDDGEYGYGGGAPDDRNGGGSGGGQENHTFPYQDGDAICVPISNDATKRAEMTRPPCEHYDRKCSLVSPCCGATFGCRICHDDSPILPPLLMMKIQTRVRYPRSSSLPGSFTSMQQTPEESHHNIDRFAVKEIICRECYTKQSSRTYVFCLLCFRCCCWLAAAEIL